MSEQDSKFDPNADFNEPETFIDRSVAAGGDDEKLPAPTGTGIPLDQGRITPFMPRDTNDLKSLVRVIVKGGVVPESYLMPNPKGGQPAKVPDMAKMAVAIIAGREHGKGPMWSLQHIMIVRGTPTVWGKGLKGLVLEKGVVTDYRLTWIDETTFIVVSNTQDQINTKRAEGYVVLWVDEFQAHMAKLMRVPPDTEPVQKWPSNLCCYLMVRRKGVDSPFIGRFSVGDAKRAGLWGHLKKKPWIQYPKDMLEHKAASRVWDRGFADCITGLYIRELVEEEGDEPAPLRAVDSSAALGGPVTIEHQPEVSNYDKEADSMLAGLEKIAHAESLERWIEAAESQLAWLTPHVPEKVAEIRETYQAKLNTLKGSDVPTSTETTKADTESKAP